MSHQYLSPEVGSSFLDVNFCDFIDDAPEFIAQPPEEETDVRLVVKAVGPATLHSSEISDLNCCNNSVLDRYLMFKSPRTKKGTVIDVFSDCYAGDCRCSHVLAGNVLQIKPCRVASVLFVDGYECSADEWKLLCGLTDGFDIVDNEDIPEYNCHN